SDRPTRHEPKPLVAARPDCRPALRRDYTLVWARIGGKQCLNQWWMLRKWTIEPNWWSPSASGPNRHYRLTPQRPGRRPGDGRREVRNASALHCAGAEGQAAPPQPSRIARQLELGSRGR